MATSTSTAPTISRPPSTAPARPFPTLSLFAIYSSTPLFPSGTAHEKHRSDAEVEASKVLYFAAPEDDPEVLTKERKARLMGTVMGMADFARMLSQAEDTPSVRSVHSLKSRMVWLEPEPGLFIHASIALPRTRRTRAASNATTASGVSSNSTANASTPSPVMLDDAALLARLELGYRTFRLQFGSFGRLLKEGGREGLVECLEGFWGQWLLRWNVGRGTSDQVERVVGGLQNSPYCTTTTAAQLAPLLAQFTASNPSVLPILLHGSTPLYLPSLNPPFTPTHLSPNLPSSSSSTHDDDRPARDPPPPLTETDLVALVEYVAAAIPSTLSIAVNPDSTTSRGRLGKDEKSAIKADDTVSSTSRWASYYTLGLGLPGSTMPTLPAIPPMSIPTLPNMPGLPSMPAMPSIPSIPIPGLSSSPSGSVSTTGGEKEKSSGGWGLRNVSWGLGLKGHNKKSSLSKAEPLPPPVPPVPGPTETQDDERTPTIPQLGEGDHERTPTLPQLEPNTTELPSFDGSYSPPASSALSGLAINVDELSLAEAMGDDESLIESARGAGSVEEVEDDEEEQEGRKMVEGKKLWCGNGVEGEEQEMEVRSFVRGSLTLTLASSPISDEDRMAWLQLKSSRLLEAVETVLEAAVPISTTFYHRHIIKTGSLTRTHGWPSDEEHWSGKPAGDDEEVAATLFDCIRGLETYPPILETFVRVSSSQWIVSRRSPDAVVSPFTSTAVSPTDFFAVLPGKVGKDGSLIDAGEELRKLERAYPRAALA
ncbi:hypothetical protein MNV49_001599 [Pseudohyphozyma bogoriensis]|nr:hypothetical protein MNV49_001599 [Pseudohyphozyma bogoriensis]